MIKLFRYYNSRCRNLVFLNVFFTLCIIFVSSIHSTELVKYSLCDIQVLYLFDDPINIDWPTLYYLNDNFGCRIDLLRIKERVQPANTTVAVKEKEIYLHTYYVPGKDSSAIESMIEKLFNQRRPDIVILANNNGDGLYKTVKEKIIALPPSASTIFNIQKIYQKFNPVLDKVISKSAVILNSREFFNRYRERMELEIPVLYSWFNIDSYKSDHLTRYQLIKSNLLQKTNEDNFLSGISPLRLTAIIDSLFPDGPMKQTLLKQAEKFIAYFTTSISSRGKNKVDLIVDGYRELRYLNQHERVIAEFPEYSVYLQNLLIRVEQAALKGVGLTWEGRIIMHDSPHGPKLKFLVSVSADGPKEIEIVNFMFHPYWDTTVVKLDSIPKVIAPHQTFVKEFLVDIDRSRLASEITDSLMFTVEVSYGQISLLFTSKLPVWKAPDLGIKIIPNYTFVKPFPKLDIDRVVTNMNIKVIITKPYDYAGVVRLNLQTPRGLFAGAYRQEIQLDYGVVSETVRIPFTISNLFELGIQNQIVELYYENRLVAADTGRIRIASCQIPDTIKIGFMPDSTGMLEDILNMAEASFRPLTDRSLIAADLEAYNVIIIGSGSFKNYPSFNMMKNRFEDYLRQGGSIVILGQPENWPGVILPVSFVPFMEMVNKKDISNKISGARILSKPYSISEKNLLSSFYKKREVTAAVITPAEKVYVTPSGGTLLSISRLGEGQIIFCGLPVLEMISKLDIDAIHLFANILNY